MTLGAGVIVYVVSLYFITMLVVWYVIGRYRRECLPRTDERFVLQEGQTILGVMDTKKTLYFCIATDVGGEKRYE
jgi:hypothetical protein